MVIRLLQLLSCHVDILRVSMTTLGGGRRIVFSFQVSCDGQVRQNVLNLGIQNQ